VLIIVNADVPVVAGTRPFYRVQLVDEVQTPIPLAALQTLTLSYYDVLTETVINTRDDQDVLNTNNVTVSASGLVTWHMQPEDTVIVQAWRQHEEHGILLTWTWDDGTYPRRDRHHVVIRIDAVPVFD
jgi:hypothetical protein